MGWISAVIFYLFILWQDIDDMGQHRTMFHFLRGRRREMISIDLFPLRLRLAFADVSLTATWKIVCFGLCTCVVHGSGNNRGRQYAFIKGADMWCLCNKLPRQKKN